MLGNLILGILSFSLYYVIVKSKNSQIYSTDWTKLVIAISLPILFWFIFVVEKTLHLSTRLINHFTRFIDKFILENKFKSQGFSLEQFKALQKEIFNEHKVKIEVDIYNSKLRILSDMTISKNGHAVYENVKKRVMERFEAKIQFGL